MTDVAVACADVVQIYESARGRVQALRGVDMAARRGTVSAVLGPSGSGKSSLLRVLGAVDLPTAGSVTVAGEPVSASARRRRGLRRRSIGFVFQRPAANLVAGVPIARQLLQVARYRQAGPSAAAAALDDVGLAHRAAHEPERLSGGEQQRAALARAVIGSPPLVIADEPTAELDVEATRAIGVLLRRLAADRGTAVVVATHDPQLLAAADHVLALRDGAVQSETLAGQERAVIDSAGRLQLPPEVLAWFPGRRVRLVLDRATNTIKVEPA